jgi:hypothetical protein
LVDLQATVADFCKEITPKYEFILVSGGNPFEETEDLSGFWCPLELQSNQLQKLIVFFKGNSSRNKLH